MTSESSPSPAKAGSGMSRRDRDIAEFAHRWYRYGGVPAEDILVTFGIDEYRFHSITLSLLTRPGALNHLPPVDRIGMERVARRRLRAEPN